MRLNFHVFTLVKIGSISYYRAVYGWRVKIKSEVMEWLRALVLAGGRGTKLNPLTKSPSSMIVKALMRNAAPGRSHCNRLQDLEYSTPEEVLSCDAVVIAAEWEEFNRLDYRGKIVIDGRRVPTSREARIYEGICW